MRGNAAEQTSEIGGPDIKSSLSSARATVAGDARVYWGLFVIWEALLIFVSGYIGAVACKSFLNTPDQILKIPPDFIRSALTAAMLAAVLVPAITRGVPALLGGQPRRWLPVQPGVAVANAVPQACLLVGIALAYWVTVYPLISPPIAWIVVWTLGVVICTAGTCVVRQMATGGALPALMPRDRVAIVGDAKAALPLPPAARLTGVFDPGADLEKLILAGQRGAVDRIVLALPGAGSDALDGLVYQLKSLNAEILRCPGIAGHMETIVPRPIGRWGIVLKFLEDQVLGGLLLLWVLPLMGLIALAIKLDSPGPVYFHQRRHGLNNVEFEVLKFRTMAWRGAAAATGEKQTERHDKRVTRVGRFLRRSSLDELPQLFNVVRGQMSLVGPRPHPVAMRTENCLGEEIVPNYAHRHRVKPGLTGWAQINGHRGATATREDIRLRVEHDLFYVENWSFLFDLRILFRTPLSLIADGENAF